MQIIKSPEIKTWSRGAWRMRYFAGQNPFCIIFQWVWAEAQMITCVNVPPRHTSVCLLSEMPLLRPPYNITMLAFYLLSLPALFQFHSYWRCTSLQSVSVQQLSDVLAQAYWLQLISQVVSTRRTAESSECEHPHLLFKAKNKGILKTRT